jgi:hypothetical protein
MGGWGSGKWHRWHARPKLEDYLQLDIRQLRQRGALKPGLSISLEWRRGNEPTGDIRIEVRDSCLILKYRSRVAGGEWENIEEFVSLSWTPCNYGGCRPWFLCPGCGRRAGVLVGAGARFLCRHCYSLKYRCQSESLFDRMHRKARKIRNRLDEDEKRKPKWMHQETFERLQENLADAELEADMALLIPLCGFSFLTKSFGKLHSS